MIDIFLSHDSELFLREYDIGVVSRINHEIRIPMNKAIRISWNLTKGFEHRSS